jgi:hypothetical protein
MGTSPNRPCNFDWTSATLVVDVLSWRSVMVGKKAVWISYVEVYGRYVVLSL